MGHALRNRGSQPHLLGGKVSLWYLLILILVIILIVALVRGL